MTMIHVPGENLLFAHAPRNATDREPFDSALKSLDVMTSKEPTWNLMRIFLNANFLREAPPARKAFTTNR